ncbi:MAG: hypothetical protein Kow0069_13720 [Promethearchaeota archaeon]
MELKEAVALHGRLLRVRFSNVASYFSQILRGVCERGEALRVARGTYWITPVALANLEEAILQYGRGGRPVEVAVTHEVSSEVEGAVDAEEALVVRRVSPDASDAGSSRGGSGNELHRELAEGFVALYDTFLSCVADGSDPADAFLEVASRAGKDAEELNAKLPRLRQLAEELLDEEGGEGE